MPSFDDLFNNPPKSALSIIQPGILPIGGKLILAGPEKVGKSYLMLRLMRDLASGGYMFGCKDFPIPDPVRLHYFEQEIGFGLYNRIHQVYNHNTTPQVRQRITYTSKDTNFRLDDATGIDKIGKEISNQGPDVVVFDPIAKFHALDENSSRDMGLIAKRLDWLSDRASKCAVIYTHHFAKPSIENPRVGSQKLRGSSALAADADTIITIEIHTDTDKYRLWQLQFTCRQQQDPLDMLVRWDKVSHDISFYGWQTQSSGSSNKPPGTGSIVV